MRTRALFLDGNEDMPESITAFDGRDIRTYLPMVVATRVVRAREDGTGTCTCSACGRHVEPSWKWCAHCRARFDGTRYEGTGE